MNVIEKATQKKRDTQPSAPSRPTSQMPTPIEGTHYTEDFIDENKGKMTSMLGKTGTQFVKDIGKKLEEHLDQRTHGATRQQQANRKEVDKKHEQGVWASMDSTANIQAHSRQVDTEVNQQRQQIGEEQHRAHVEHTSVQSRMDATQLQQDAELAEAQGRVELAEKETAAKTQITTKALGVMRDQKLRECDEKIQEEQIQLEMGRKEELAKRQRDLDNEQIQSEQRAEKNIQAERVKALDTQNMDKAKWEIARMSRSHAFAAKKHEIDMKAHDEARDAVLDDKWKQRRRQDLEEALKTDQDDMDIVDERKRMERRKARIEFEKAKAQMEDTEVKDAMALMRQQELTEQAKSSLEDSVEEMRRRRETQRKIAQSKADAENVSDEMINKLSLVNDNKLKELQAHATVQVNCRQKEAQVKERLVNSSLDVIQTNIKMNSSLNGRRRAMVADVERTLKIEKEDMDEADGVKFKLQKAKILFLGVILGCELDLYGFTLAFITYWAAGKDRDDVTNQRWLIHWLLCIGPFAYFLATFMYIAWTYGWVTKMLIECCGLNEDEAPQPVTRMKKDLEQPLLSTQKNLSTQQKVSRRSVSGKFTETYNEFDQEMAKESVTLKFYHFFPLFRYYLLVKDAEPNDVESLFRVNALSTFTLGFTQLACFLLGVTTRPPIMHFDVMIGVGMFAQAVNFAMTFVFFFTSTPELMKSSMSIDALQFSKRLALATDSTKYQFACEQFANSFGELIPEMDLDEFAPPGLDQKTIISGTEAGEAGAASATTFSVKPKYTPEQQKLLREVAHFRQKGMREINEVAKLQLNLSPYSTEQLFEWRKKLATRMIAQHCALAGV